VKIAVIPARGGSKRIPRKNITPFLGKPVISYSIETALQSGFFDRVIVSTDDEEVATIANSYGAEVPFTRPSELADDHTATVPVVAHAIEYLQGTGESPEWICCLYPTAIFTRISDIKGAFDLLQNYPDCYVIPITIFPSTIQRALRYLQNGQLKPFDPEHVNTRTQDLESAYYDVGQFYWARAKTWLSNLQIHSNGIGWTLPRYLVQDIDTLEDWEHAELMYSTLRESGHLV